MTIKTGGETTVTKLIGHSGYHVLVNRGQEEGLTSVNRVTLSIPLHYFQDHLYQCSHCKKEINNKKTVHRCFVFTRLNYVFRFLYNKVSTYPGIFLQC